MNLLFVGDVVGRCGRRVLNEHLGRLVDEHMVDLVVANGENAAGGFGLTLDVAREMFDLGVDVITSGNHIWDKREIYDHLDGDRPILRPANYPPGVPGRGAGVFTTAGGVEVAVVNLEGRVFMSELDCPFRAADALIEDLQKRTPIIFVDFHAEATSEKAAMGCYLDGRVSALAGTHTHVQTADERILPGGTGYITDVGLTGSLDSVIGIRKELAIERFLTQLPVRFEVSRKRPVLCAILFVVDEKSGRTERVLRIQKEI